MAGQRRATATVKMSYSEDADLIAWWNAVPRGSRNAVMKDMMRDYIERNRGGFRPIFPRNQPAPFDPKQFLQLVDDAAWIRGAINDLPGYVERLVEQVTAGALAYQTAEKVPRSASRSRNGTDDAALRRREAHIRKAGW